MFKESLITLYPELKNSGTIRTKDVESAMKANGVKKFPHDILVKMSRGVFALRDTDSPVTAEVVPFPTKEVTLVPSVDKNYVAFGNHKDVEQIIKSGIFYPTYITGPTGNGKSTMVEQICAKHKKNLIRVNLNMMSDEDQLIGSKTLTNGNVEIVEGPVLIAMRTGSTLLLDEIDAGSANTLLCLQPILEGKPYYFKLKNETIIPAPGFNIFATANTKGKGSDDGRFIGTNVMNEAFLERFSITMEQEYPAQKTETKILNNVLGASGIEAKEFVDKLVTWADVIRKSFYEGALSEIISTRRLVHICEAFAIFNQNKMKAIELCLNRFDVDTKNAFLELYRKVDETVDPNVETDMAKSSDASTVEVAF